MFIVFAYIAFLVSDRIKPVKITHYINKIETSGDIKIRSKIKSNNALFKIVTCGNNAKLYPLSKQFADLTVEERNFLNLTFTISGTRGDISNRVIPAEYELKNDNVWSMKTKGVLN